MQRRGRQIITAERQFERAVALFHAEDLAGAIQAYEVAVSLRPDWPEALNNLGVALRSAGRCEEAIVCYGRALLQQPDRADATGNRGLALHDLGRLDEAIDWLRRAVRLQPHNAAFHNNLGTALGDSGQADAAIVSFRAVLALDPAYAQAHTNLGMALLGQGDFPAGWREYEWRWAIPTYRPRPFPQPQWRGEPGRGRTLLIHAEQGYGDSIQFCRYAMLAAACGWQVMLEVQPALVRLLRSLPVAPHVLAHGETLPWFDQHCPMLSLPGAVQQVTASIPAASAYLRAEAGQVAAWRDRLAPYRPALLVGLVWAGNGAPGLAAIDRRRSLPPSLLTGLAGLPGLQWVSLQKTGPAAPPELPIIDAMAEMADFADTAALVEALDLVVSVDTAVAHLAAALGKPVWLLDRFAPCWRWLAGRQDSPWYPTLRILRQPSPGDWGSVVAKLGQGLRRRAPAASSQ